MSNKLNLTDNEVGLVGALRDNFETVPESETSWPIFEDFLRSNARMLSGLETFVPPPEMKSRFDAMWRNYVKLMAAEQERIFGEAVNDPALVTHLKSDPDNAPIVNEIMSRAMRQSGGFKVGVSVNPVDCSDLFIDDEAEEI